MSTTHRNARQGEGRTDVSAEVDREGRCVHQVGGVGLDKSRRRVPRRVLWSPDKVGESASCDACVEGRRQTDPNNLRPPCSLHVLYDLSLDAFHSTEERLQLLGRLELSLVLFAFGVERPELHARRREVVVDDELEAGWT